MNGKEFHVRSRRPRPLVLGLAFLLCLMGFSVQALFAAPPAPRVRFDQTVDPPDVPPQVLIGENFTFRVRFKNDLSVPGASMGYGPFIDLVLDAGGANMAKPLQTPACSCDGMMFVQANMIAVNGGAVPLVSHPSLAPCAPLPSQVTLIHPFASSAVSPVQVPAGSELVTLELPFGSFDPTQPEIVVEVTAHVSNLADVGLNAPPLKIYARGGFRYGGLDALDNPSIDCPILSDINSNTTPPCTNQITVSAQWAAPAQTTPTVMIVSKKYLGPEDETATGPNFIRSYQITLDIATGQTITNPTVTDHLPNNMAYVGPLSASPPCFTVSPIVPVAGVAHSGTAADLILKCSSITGGVHPLPPAVPIHDATIAFGFFIPELDANVQPVLSPTCGFVPSINNVRAEGDWTPVDACDTSPHVFVDYVTPADHPLLDKCLAIQKTVADLSGGPPAHPIPPAAPIPGGPLLYTLNFQLSDFRTAGNLKVQDVLSDGQTLVPASLTLTVTDQCGTTSGSIPASAWTTTLSCGAGAPGEPPPRTELDIDVSAAMATLATLATPSGPLRHLGGFLTGGYAFAPSTTSTVPATGTITFQTVIDDAYQCPVASPHDLFVDKDDPLTNTVTLAAAILANGGSCLTTTPSATGVTAQDGSKVEFLIATDFLEKTVYAVKRGIAQICGPNTSPCPSKPELWPGDEVTFRLKKTIPSSDAENLTIQDWLPLPTFLVAGGGFSNSQCGIPATGNSCLGPANTLSVPSKPTYSADAATNSIKFDYGTFNDTTNQPHTIDLLFTRTVTNTPSPDGLYKTNEAQECESNTFGVTFCQTAIAQVQVREPALKITKGVVDTNNPFAVFSPSQVGPPAVPFHPPDGCPRFSTLNSPLTSTNLAVTPIRSDVSNVDANDCVTFAIVVENTGGSPAYDIKLGDIFPLDSTGAPECFAPDVHTLCVTDGTGTSIPFSPLFVFPVTSITLSNPLPGVSSTPGSNIAVITFDACIVGNVKPHCCDNTAKVENYASTQGGPNFVGGPLQDTARLCVLPKATKSIKITSEAHTSETSVPRPLAVGEIIRYRLEVVVPETTSPSNYTLTDLLPPGLQFLNDNTTKLAFVSNGGVSSSSPGIGTLPFVLGNQVNLSTITPTFLVPQSAISPATFACGSPPSFNLGNLTNTDNDFDQELIVLEFNALVCNIASNQNGATLTNSFGVLVDGLQVANLPTVSAVVVEPNIIITKVAAVPSLTVGAAAVYTITLANIAPNGTATAFDVQLTDLLPVCLTNLSNVQITTGGGVTGVVNTSTAAALNLAIVSIPVNGTVTVQYSATLSCVDCSKLINNAKVTWTSLPGSFGTIANPTNSSIPGTSGLSNGERDGSGVVNDYVAVASASLCCSVVSDETIICNRKDGTFTYTFTVTNLSSSTTSGISFVPPAGVTITPGSLPTTLPPNGGSTTVTVTIGGPGAVSGASICFTVALSSAARVCRTDHCITMPKCCADPPPKMAAWYTLDELQGATAVNDIAPPTGSFNNVGTPHPGLVGAGGPKPVVGQVNGALYFTAGPYVEVPSQSDLTFGGGSFSIDAWVRAVGCGPGQLSAIVDKLDTSTNTGFAFYLDQPSPGTAVLKLQVNSSTFTSTGSITANANPLLNTGPWFHVAVTVDVSTPVGVVTFYINGSPQGSFTTSTGPLTNTVPMWIGQTRVPPGSRCEIAIDELELFHLALTAAEVKDISDAGSWGKCHSGGVICLTKFEDLNGSGLQDPLEPLLAAWAFNVTDQNNVLVGTITTNPPGMPQACLTVPAGTYTITEQVQANWTPTTPNPRTVTVLPGQTENLSFGNIHRVLPCMLVSDEKTSCNLKDGTFTYTFTVTNLSNSTVSSVELSPTSPANATITPGSTTIPSLAPGASTTVTVTIGGPGAVSGASICFRVALNAKDGVAVCSTEHCITLPKCCADPPPNMVAWYPLDEPRGAAVNDIAPPPGSSVNNVGHPQGAAGSPQPVTGKVNGALYFNGPYVEVAPQTELDFGGGSFSIDAWVRAVSCERGTLSPIVDKLATFQNPNRGFSFYLETVSPGSAVLKLQVNGSTFTGGAITANANPLLNTGTWFHIAVTVNVEKREVTFYINGLPAGTFTTSTGPLSSDVPMWIGQTHLEGHGCAIAIDELELFNRPVTQPEIQGIFNADSHGKCTTGSICVTKFEDLNRNGKQDPGEPLLPDWRFNVTDQNNILVGTINTSPTGARSACLTVPSGTYTIAEHVQAGWTPTTAIEQTVTVSAGQTVNVSFGNWIFHRQRAVRR